MTRYVLSEDADLDLDSIWEFIAEDNIDAADRWIGKLFDCFDTISNAPGIGHKREDLTEYPVLFWPMGAYLIIYRVTSRAVEIVDLLALEIPDRVDVLASNHCIGCHADIEQEHDLHWQARCNHANCRVGRDIGGIELAARQGGVNVLVLSEVHDLYIRQPVDFEQTLGIGHVPLAISKPGFDANFERSWFWSRGNGRSGR